MQRMTKTERVKAALNCEETDRVPVSVWLHFSDKDQDPRSLAEAQVDFVRKYDFDFIKLMPFGLYSVQDWGCKIKIFGTSDNPPIVDDFGIKDIQDWRAIEELPAMHGTWGKQVQLAQHVSQLVGDGIPFIQTIFSPLTTARKLAGDRIFNDMKKDSGIFHDALQVITNTTVNFIKANIEVGVSGFFFATQNATYDLMTDEEYDQFGKAYDLRLFDQYTDQTWFNVVHIHGDNIMYDKLADYPGNCINWHDRWVAPSLAEARKLSGKCLLGGISENEVLATGTPDELQNHIHEAIESAGKQGLMIGPGCVANPKTPIENYFATRVAVEQV